MSETSTDGRGFTLRLADHSMTPETVSVQELAQILEAIGRAMQLQPKDNGLEKDDLQEDFFVSLVGIGGGSTKLALAYSDPALGQSRYQALVNMLADSSEKHRKPSAAAELHRVAKKLGTVIQLYGSLQPLGKPDVEVKPETDEASEMTIAGETSLYGVVERVGGRLPKVRIRMWDGTALNIEVTQAFARKLASYLYQEVELRGLAKWDARDGTILRFIPHEVFGCEDGNVAEGFRELAEICGSDAWNDADDVLEAIIRLREGGCEW